MIGALASLGALAGYIIARMVPDETGWYPKYFLLGAALFALAAGLTTLWLGLVFAGVMIFYTARRMPYGVTLGAIGLGLHHNPLAWKLLFISLMLGTGYMYSKGVRKELWWLAAMPIVIIALSLLV